MMMRRPGRRSGWPAIKCSRQAATSRPCRSVRPLLTWPAFERNLTVRAQRPFSCFVFSRKLFLQLNSASRIGSDQQTIPFLLFFLEDSDGQQTWLSNWLRSMLNDESDAERNNKPIGLMSNHPNLVRNAELNWNCRSLLFLFLLDVDVVDQAQTTQTGWIPRCGISVDGVV